MGPTSISGWSNMTEWPILFDIFWAMSYTHTDNWTELPRYSPTSSLINRNVDRLIKWRTQTMNTPYRLSSNVIMLCSFNVSHRTLRNLVTELSIHSINQIRSRTATGMRCIHRIPLQPNSRCVVWPRCAIWCILCHKKTVVWCWPCNRAHAHTLSSFCLFGGSGGGDGDGGGVDDRCFNSRWSNSFTSSSNGDSTGSKTNA